MICFRFDYDAFAIYMLLPDLMPYATLHILLMPSYLPLLMLLLFMILRYAIIITMRAATFSLMLRLLIITRCRITRLRWLMSRYLRFHTPLRYAAMLRCYASYD